MSFPDNFVTFIVTLDVCEVSVVDARCLSKTRIIQIRREEKLIQISVYDSQPQNNNTINTHINILTVFFLNIKSVFLSCSQLNQTLDALVK